MSINGPRVGRSLFPEEDEEEAIPFASLEKSQRSVTMHREFYSLPTPWLAIAVNLIVVGTHPTGKETSHATAC